MVLPVARLELLHPSTALRRSPLEPLPPWMVLRLSPPERLQPSVASWMPGPGRQGPSMALPLLSLELLYPSMLRLLPLVEQPRLSVALPVRPQRPRPSKVQAPPPQELHRWML
jgi:hypothetical protein